MYSIQAKLLTNKNLIRNQNLIKEVAEIVSNIALKSLLLKMVLILKSQIQVYYELRKNQYLNASKSKSNLIWVL